MSKIGRHRQTKPDGMPDKIWQEVLDGKRCGAKTKAGGWCRKKPYIKKPDRHGPGPFRCERHGGASANVSKGVPGNKGNRKHGIYAKALSDAEKEMWAELAADSVDDEILMTKIRLKRAFVAEAEQERELAKDRNYEDDLELESRTVVNKESHQESSVTRKRPNFKQIIDRLVNQLTRLIAQKIALENDGDVDIEKTAQKVRAAVGEARSDPDKRRGFVHLPVDALGVVNADRN